jgi:hypothetical protein
MAKLEGREKEDMVSEIIEYKIGILPGRHDLLRLKEMIEYLMQSLISTVKCTVIADFDSVKYIASSMEILSPEEENSLKIRKIENCILGKYLYESCVLTIRSDAKNKDQIVDFLKQLSQMIIDRGGRIENYK